ncbi:hypothetical protein B9W68_16905 [Streptomyces sp. CS227]|nr:hypothetical protein B9W68_16905 [Streptomyces sp. CS227]
MGVRSSHTGSARPGRRAAAPGVTDGPGSPPQGPEPHHRGGPARTRHHHRRTETDERARGSPDRHPRPGPPRASTPGTRR